MGAVLVINATGVETRVALVENGTISEYYLERKKDKGIVGNIYKGKVVRVLPGMQAAFVDIGLEKAAFLYVSDVFYDPDFSEQQFDLTEGEHEEVEDVPEAAAAEEAESAAAPEARPAEQQGPQVAEEKPAAKPPEAEKQPEAKAEPVAAQTSESKPASAPEAPTEERAVAPEAATEAKPVEPAAASVSEEQKPSAAPEVKPEAAEAAEAAAAPEQPEAAVGKTEQTAEAEEAPEQEPAAQKIACTGDAPALAPAQAPAPELPDAEPAAAADGGGEEAEGQAAEQQRPRGEFRVRGRRRRRGGARREMREPRPEREEQEPPQQQRGDAKGQQAQKKTANIQDLLKVGQEIIVQVAKDPIGTKGARVTSHISLPGRHLVFMPTVDHVGISRRIERESERRRLREIVDRLRPPGTGFIVRTVAENVSTEKLEADARFLIGIWNTVGAKKERLGAPALLHPDLDLTLRATRDLFAQDVEQLVIDDRAEWERISAFVEAQDPALKQRVVLHDSDEPIFDAYGIEHELQRAQQRKVWLKSGGYLIIDQAEALTAIDVNSGRYVGKKSLEETITRINTEAAKEIVYQLRLRNIGGIIIIDFIDMDKAQNRDKVFKALQDALGRDKAKTNILKISELGLVEMTRKRVRESLGRTLNEPCSYCDGRGYVKSKRTVAYEIFREIRREANNFRESVLVVNCHPDVARILQVDEREELRYLMDRYNKSIHVRAQQNYHQEQYDLYGKSERPQKRVEREEERGDQRRDKREERVGELQRRAGEEKRAEARGDRDRRGEGRERRGEEKRPEEPGAREEKRAEEPRAREEKRLEEQARREEKRADERERQGVKGRAEPHRVEEPAAGAEVAAKPLGES